MQVSEWPSGDEAAASPRAESPAQQGSWLGFWAKCLLLGLVVRFIPVTQVFSGGEVRPFGTDSYYHLRRIEAAVRDFPAMLEFDPYLNHPLGARQPYEPGLDLLLAAFTRLLSFSETPSFQHVAALCSVAMPFLGLLVIPLYAAITRRLGGADAQKATAVLLAVLPGVSFPGLVGQVDHHVLEPLVMGLPLWLVMRAQEEAGRLRLSLLAGLSLGLGLFFWRGVLLPAGLLALFVGLRAVWMSLKGLLDRFTRDEAPFMFLTASAVALLPPVLVPAHEPFTYFTISLLQPLTLALLALGLYLVGIFAVQLASMRARTDALHAPVGGRELLTAVLMLGIAGSAPLLLVGLLNESLAQNLLAGLGFLSREDVFVRTVGEQRPLLVGDDGGFTLSYLLTFYGGFAFLWPVALWGGYQAGGRSRARQLTAGVLPDFRWWLLLLWTLIAGWMAFTQRRYAAHFAPLTCVWLGLGWVWLRDRLAKATSGRRLGMALVLTVLTFPTFLTYAVLMETPTQSPALLEAMRWVELNTPPTRAFFPGTWLWEPPPSLRPEYGVLTPWDEGHHVLALARRPNIGNPFGISWFKPGLEGAARVWLAPAEMLAAQLDAVKARYAVLSFRLGLLRDEALYVGLPGDRFAVREGGLWQPGPAFWNLGVTQLYLVDAPGAPQGWQERLSVPGVRVVWEGARLPPDAPARRLASERTPEYQVVERVEGARLQGQTQPFARVRAEQGVKTPSGRSFMWRAEVVADALGMYELRGLYPSQPVQGVAVEAQGPLKVMLPERTVLLLLDEESIQSGRKITLP